MTFARWRKCDFQLHTPRDPNWSGPRPMGLNDIVLETACPPTADEVASQRTAWANEFLKHCISKGLQAIAVTDHHEMIMSPYIEHALRLMKAADASIDLWVFPGMELTAIGGKQCLILFDSDITISWRQQVLGRLGIIFAEQGDLNSTHSRVSQLSCSYPEIGPALDELEDIKGRYIILPNMSQGGRFTVLVDGGHAEFKSMPYIGGYLDRGQTIETLSPRYRRRISGQDRTWSPRTFYPIPTSDSRSADFANIGTNDTWIKLAAPTAEAIRQAFLAHPSRIQTLHPNLPSVYIAQLRIMNSRTLPDGAVAFSPELNSFIGGRGSGKSSFLEYLSFALGRSCYDAPREYFESTRLHSLVEDTLIQRGGAVEVDIVLDGAAFTIVRSAEQNHHPKIVYPDGAVQTVSLKELRALFPAVVYSQGELAQLGDQAGKTTRLSDLLQFVDPRSKEEDARLTSKIEGLRAEVSKAVHSLVAYWTIQSLLQKATTRRSSLRQRVEALEKTLPALSEEDQSAVNEFDVASEFEDKRVQAGKHAEDMISTVADAALRLSSERDLDGDTGALAVDIRVQYKAMLRAFTDQLGALLQELRRRRGELAELEEKWAKYLGTKRDARDDILKKLSTHKVTTAQISNLRSEIHQCNQEIGDLEVKQSAAGNPAVALSECLDELRSACDERASKTREWALEIQSLSVGKVKAEVIADSNAAELKSISDILTAKTGSQEAIRHRAVDDMVAESSFWACVDTLRTECLELVKWRILDESLGRDQPESPQLARIAGTSRRILSQLVERLDVGKLALLASITPQPNVSLSYCDGPLEISFDKASEGQRAAALLFMLLKQRGGPLVVDQPEGDLDNKIVSELTEVLHNAKQMRQIVFASHNANIVVNGSSELVIHLTVAQDGRRCIECIGAIDASDIRSAITSCMEGGRTAFKARQEKYGF